MPPKSNGRHPTVTLQQSFTRTRRCLIILGADQQISSSGSFKSKNYERQWVVRRPSPRHWLGNVSLCPPICSLLPLNIYLQTEPSFMEYQCPKFKYYRQSALCPACQTNDEMFHHMYSRDGVSPRGCFGNLLNFIAKTCPVYHNRCVGLRYQVNLHPTQHSLRWFYHHWFLGGRPSAGGLP